MYSDAEIAAVAPALNTFEWKQCRHEAVCKSGFLPQPDGRPLVRCMMCGRRWPVGPTRNEIRREGIARVLLEPGASVRTARERIRCAKGTAESVSRMLRSIRRMPCPCGRPAGHLGRCSFRRLKS